VLDRPHEDHIEGPELRWASRHRGFLKRVSLVLVPILVLAAVLLTRWIGEPDPFSPDAARATLASLGVPIQGATLGSQVIADWPRTGPGIAFITAGRAYALPVPLTVGEVVRELHVWAAQHRLAPADAEPSICWDLSQQAYDARAPGAEGPVCVIGSRLADQPFQRITISIMFNSSGSRATSPRRGEPWTTYEGNTVSQVVIDVTVTEERPLPNTD